MAAAVAAALLVALLDLYLTGHGHGSVTREVITWTNAGVHLSIADVGMLMTGIAVAILTWYLVGHGRTLRSGKGKPRLGSKPRA